MRTRNPRLWLRLGPVWLFGPAVAGSILGLGLAAMAGWIVEAGIVWIAGLCLWHMRGDIARGGKR